MKNKNESVAETPSRARVHAPRLRFPEFRDKGEWEELVLGEFAEIIEERTQNRKIPAMSISSGIGLVPQVEKFGKEIAGDQYKNYLVLRKNEFAYNKSATKQYPEGFIAMLEEFGEASVPPSIFTCFRATDSKILPQILKQLFLINHHGKYIKKYIQVGARAHGSLSIDDKDILQIPFILPTYKEQQKIAACLSSLDSLIAAHGKKLEALKAWKKGLLQRLFPVEDEKVPRLRFPGFKGEWEEHRIGEDFEFGKSANNSRADLSDTGDVFYVHYGDIHTKFNTRIDFKKDTLPRISSSLNKNVTLLKNGDLILADASEDTEGIGKAVEVFGLEDGVKAIAGLHTIVLRDTKKKYVDGFRGILRDISTVRKQFDRLAVGVKVYSVSKSILEGIMVPLPYYTEQRKIASALSSLDSLIAAQTRKIEELKDHKRGLMQGLFPETDNEVHTS